jgi:hypothetical protein
MRFALLASTLVLFACGGSTAGGGADGGTSTGAGGSGGSGGGAVCTVACTTGFTCCNGTCINPNNDILNCGVCGHACDGPTPFCNGACVTPPCTGAACSNPAFCCGDQCCNAGQLCCDVPGPVERGPLCTDPVDGTCPKGCPACRCTSPDTPIATPEGSRPIASLRRGDYVYSVAGGRVAVVRVREVRRVPASHHVVTRLVMESGAILEISGVHPTADGRTIGELRVGDELDGVRVVGASVVPYTHDATYDILPDSDTGAYFAGGVLIGSTLAARAVDMPVATSPACE